MSQLLAFRFGAFLPRAPCLLQPFALRLDSPRRIKYSIGSELCSFAAERLAAMARSGVAAERKERVRSFALVILLLFSLLASARGQPCMTSSGTEVDCTRRLLTSVPSIANSTTVLYVAPPVLFSSSGSK
jgi:hypothetical protein